MVRALFAYGTLLVPDILEQVIGRRPPRLEARLDGYVCRRVRDQVYPAVIECTESSVSGALYVDLEPADFAALDHYEGDLYERRRVSVLSDGAPAPAYTYVLSERFRHHLTEERWQLDEFEREHLPGYRERLAATRAAPRRLSD